MTEHDREERELEALALETLARAHARQPPASLRARLLEQIGREASERQAARRVSRWRTLAIASSAAAATLAGFLVLQSLAGGRIPLGERENLLARLEQQERDLLLLEDALNVHSEVVRILTSPHSVSASLTSPEGRAGSVRVLLDPATGAVAVLGKGLPPPQAGRVYELWAIRDDGTPEAAGTLEAAGGRSFAVRLRQVSEPGAVRQFGLSVEPAGGAERPSGPMVLAGFVQP
jgi:anti-sigma-K factor RskA